MLVKTKHTALFTVWCIALVGVFPIVAATLETRMDQAAFSWPIYWKWFIFWGVGIRLFFKGIQLASTGYLSLLELGFANMALGSMGILSVINDQWRLLAAIVETIHFGLADMLRLFKKPGSLHEWMALIYNLLVFAGLVSYLVWN